MDDSVLTRLLGESGLAVDIPALDALLRGINAAPGGHDPDAWLELVGTDLSAPLVAALRQRRAALQPRADGPVDRRERLARFRAALSERGADGFVLMRTDEHGSEYLPGYAERVAWLTGFTGSAAQAAVLPDRATVLSDGRYTVQLAQEVDDALFERGHSGEQPLSAWLEEHLPTGARLGYDPWLARRGERDRLEKIAKAKGLKKWATCSPDYAYGRSNTAEFMEYAKHFDGTIQVVEESWPKLFQPDYTEVVTKVLNAKADAMYSALWGGDLVAFIDQANLYGLFDKQASFMVNLGDYGVVDQVKQFPQGVYSGGRYNRTVPPTKENEEWYQNYVKTQKHKPTNWSWENDVAAQMVVEALKKTNGDTNGKKLAEVIKGLTIKTQFGVGGSVNRSALAGAHPTSASAVPTVAKRRAVEGRAANVRPSSFPRRARPISPSDARSRRR